MPFPADEKLMQLSRDLLAAFDAIFGVHPGFRAAHAKGVLLSGTFTPSAAAAKLSSAPHLNQAETPVFVRFSNSTGLPAIPDRDPNANPRGMAIRFQLAEHVHTDIVSHSANAFPAKNGQEFLGFFQAVAESGKTQSPAPVQAFVGAHPAALAFVQLPKPAPTSFAREAYFGLTAMRFIDAGGKSRYGRYRIVPDAGVEHLDEASTASQPDNFLFEEIAQRVTKSALAFKVILQLADESDIVDDVTVHWPETREQAELGKLSLNALVPNNAGEQKTIIFDPIPRVAGIEPSADPLLELRAAIYLLSGRRRRQA